MQAQTNVKNTVYKYLSPRVNEGNYKGLQSDLAEADGASTGLMDSEQFIRALSKNHMKLGQTEVSTLISKLKNEMDQINYKEFLKFSYLCHLFSNHMKLEEAMREADKENGD